MGKVDAKRPDYVPHERPGAAPMSLTYDYLVVALGNQLAYDQITGSDEFDYTVIGTYYGNRLHHYFLHGNYSVGGTSIIK